MMVRLHPRERPVMEATADLRHRVAEWLDAHPDLTIVETLKVLASVFHDETQGILKYAIRIERHGDADKEGGLE
jgi:hypothetical protein